MPAISRWNSNVKDLQSSQSLILCKIKIYLFLQIFISTTYGLPCAVLVQMTLFVTVLIAAPSNRRCVSILLLSHYRCGLSKASGTRCFSNLDTEPHFICIEMESCVEFLINSWIIIQAGFIRRAAGRKKERTTNPRITQDKAHLIHPVSVRFATSTVQWMSIFLVHWFHSIPEIRHINGRRHDLFLSLIPTLSQPAQSQTASGRMKVVVHLYSSHHVSRNWPSVFNCSRNGRSDTILHPGTLMCPCGIRTRVNEWFYLDLRMFFFFLILLPSTACFAHFYA